MKVKCVVAEERNRVVVGSFNLREASEGEVLVKTLFSTISPGTELRCLAGNEPNAGRFPMITGYSLAGKVLRGAGTIQEGDLVFLNGTSVCPAGISSSWGGHISHAIASVSQAVKLPKDIDPKMASALSMLSIAMHGVCRSAPLPGDNVLVAGQGLIGQFAARFMKMAGCRVAVCDPVMFRLDTARRMGMDLTYQVSSGWQDKFRGDFPDGVDILIDATGSPQAVAANAPLLRAKSWENPYQPSPKLVLLASYPGNIILDYQETLFNKELKIVTCRTYLPHERERVIRLLAEKSLDITPLLTATMPADEAAEAFRLLREDASRHITIVLDWSGAT